MTELEKRYQKALKLLARCRNTLDRPGWAEGETQSEVLDAVREFLMYEKLEDEIFPPPTTPAPPKPEPLPLKVGSLVKCKPGTPGPNNLSGRFGYVTGIGYMDLEAPPVSADVQFADFISKNIPIRFLEVRNPIG